eukprot:Gb_31710 [translate_table: standard]
MLASAKWLKMDVRYNEYSTDSDGRATPKNAFQRETEEVQVKPKDAAGLHLCIFKGYVQFLSSEVFPWDSVKLLFLTSYETFEGIRNDSSNKTIETAHPTPRVQELIHVVKSKYMKASADQKDTKNGNGSKNGAHAPFFISEYDIKPNAKGTIRGKLELGFVDTQKKIEFRSQEQDGRIIVGSTKYLWVETYYESTRVDLRMGKLEKHQEQAYKYTSNTLEDLESRLKLMESEENKLNEAERGSPPEKNRVWPPSGAGYLEASVLENYSHIYQSPIFEHTVESSELLEENTSREIFFLLNKSSQRHRSFHKTLTAQEHGKNVELAKLNSEIEILKRQVHCTPQHTACQVPS